jgi:exopolysaccharide biosynthesis protein
MRQWWIVPILITLLLLAGCGESYDASVVVPTLMPTPTNVVLPSLEPDEPAPPDLLDTGWRRVSSGVAVRRFQVQVGSDGRTARLSVARIDPALVTFRVGYAPSDPLTLPAWAASERTVAVINGGFFDADNRTVALVVSDGNVYGTSYIDQGAMFSVAGDGSVRLRSLTAEPYDPGEAPQQALQGWPLLVQDGFAAYTFEDNERARRSILALDATGQVLLIACSTASFTLAELAQWLAQSDLAINAAVNLDGGSSTGLLIAGNGEHEQVDAFVPLPIVLLVYAR